MPCKHYKDALIEAAVNDAEPQGDLRAHLIGCADCRAAFEQEQSLFASIDLGLRVAANAEVPASLLPRVRVRIAEEAEPSRIWMTNWVVLASAAVVVALLAARAFWHPNVVQQPVVKEAKATVQPLVTEPQQKHDPALGPPMEKNPTSQRQDVVANLPPAHEMPVRGKTVPEVLVPQDQEILLAEYAEQWSLHKRAPLVARDSDATILAQLQVAPIQIDELGVKLLAEEK